MATAIEGKQRGNFIRMSPAGIDIRQSAAAEEIFGGTPVIGHHSPSPISPCSARVSRGTLHSAARDREKTARTLVATVFFLDQLR